MRVNKDGILGETLENGLQVFGFYRSKKYRSISVRREVFMVMFLSFLSVVVFIYVSSFPGTPFN